MRNIIKTLSIFGIIFLLANCEKDIELVNPNESRKATVRCILQEDSIYKLELYKSNKPLTSHTSFDLITDAIVEIIDDNGNKETLSFSGGDKMINGISQGYYSSNSLVDGTKNYKLNITHNDYKDLTSSLKFPNKTTVSNIKLTEEVINEYGYEYTTNTLKFDLTDDINNRDFYKISADYTYYDAIYSATDTILTGPFTEIVYLYAKEAGGNGFNISEGESATLFSDVFFNGSTKSLEFVFDLYINEQYEDGSQVTYERIIEDAFVNIETLSEAYYRYFTTVEKQQMTQGNPFSEAVIIKNNIENGLGIFGAKRLFRFEIDF